MYNEVNRCNDNETVETACSRLQESKVLQIDHLQRYRSFESLRRTFL
jgi:hypothetical protein